MRLTGIRCRLRRLNRRNGNAMAGSGARGVVVGTHDFIGDFAKRPLVVDGADISGRKLVVSGRIRDRRSGESELIDIVQKVGGRSQRRRIRGRGVEKIENGCHLDFRDGRNLHDFAFVFDFFVLEWLVVVRVARRVRIGELAGLVARRGIRRVRVVGMTGLDVVFLVGSLTGRIHGGLLSVVPQRQGRRALAVAVSHRVCLGLSSSSASQLINLAKVEITPPIQKQIKLPARGIRPPRLLARRHGIPHELEHVPPHDAPRVLEPRVPTRGLAGVDLPAVQIKTPLAGDVAPDADDFEFVGAAALVARFAGGDGGGVAEAEEEGDAAFGEGEVFAAAFGAVVDLVGRVADGVVEGSAVGGFGGLGRLGGHGGEEWMEWNYDMR
mmetsp:Transcript_19232/g.40437  ORF Transcript_19232/g.40437 Transcript_19232/m.40437 type:complete len:382 (-) Transcript_19232:286-1431(-)